MAIAAGDDQQPGSSHRSGRAVPAPGGAGLSLPPDRLLVQSYATSFFRRYLDGLRSAGRLLDPRTPGSKRVELQTVGMP